LPGRALVAAWRPHTLDRHRFPHNWNPKPRLSPVSGASSFPCVPPLMSRASDPAILGNRARDCRIIARTVTPTFAKAFDGLEAEEGRATLY